MSRDHSAVREDGAGRAGVTCTPRPRAQASASGESAAPTVNKDAPRRAASAASATGPMAYPDCDTAITRSSGPTQPGNGPSRRVVTGTGELGSVRRSRTSPTTDEPPRAAKSTARGRSPEATRSMPDSCAATTARRTWAPDRARARRLSLQSSRARASTSSRAASSRKAIARRPQPGRRASSMRRTGMPSSIR